MKIHPVYLVYLLSFLLQTSCATNDDIIGEDFNVVDSYSIRKTGFNIINSINFQGLNRSAQGMAIDNYVMYRLYDTGICQTFDISDIENPIPICQFELGSYMQSNHGNCAQFLPRFSDEEYSYLYVAGLQGKCFVERINRSSSTLVQTITLGKLEMFNNQQRFNIVCGDDSCLWLFGEDEIDRKLHFAKIKRPSLNIGDYCIGQSDILDYWSESDYVYDECVWQGGKVYNGKLFFVFGTPSSKRRIVVYDTNTHSKVETIELNDYISEELEDCEILDGKIIIAIYGGRGYYVMDNVQSLVIK